MNTNLQKAFLLLEGCFEESEKFFGTPASRKQVTDAENFLNIQFPSSYRFFLEKYGFGGVGGFDVDGLTSYDFEESGMGGVIWSAVERRQKFSYPLYLLPIYDVGEGTTYCLDTSQMREDGECPVVAWPLGGYDETPVLEIVAQDFGQFFLDKVLQEVEAKKAGRRKGDV